MLDYILKKDHDVKIIGLYEQGHSIKAICSLFFRKYNQNYIAGVISMHQMTIQRDYFVVIPSKMNLDFQIKK
jgi:hypothetical protein